MRVKSTVFTFLLCSLASNAAMAGFGDFMNSLTGSDEKKEEVQPPAWASEPLLTDQQCDNIKVNSITSFMDKYKMPYLVQDSMDAAAIKARHNYILSAAVTNRALLCTAESLALKDSIKELNLEREILLSGTSLSSSEMDKHRSYSDTANEEIKLTLEKKSKVDPEQKKTMVLSFTMLLTGGYLTYETTKKLQRYEKEIRNEAGSIKDKLSGGDLIGGLTSLGRGLAGGSDIFSLYKASLSNGIALGQTAMTYHKFFESNDIEVPKDTTEIYSAVTGAVW